MADYEERMRERVIQAREEKGWSPEELALRADVSAKQVRRIEKGQSKNPRLSTLRKIADATGREVTWIRPDLEAEEAELNQRLERIEDQLQRIEGAVELLLDAAEAAGTTRREPNTGRRTTPKSSSTPSLRAG